METRFPLRRALHTAERRLKGRRYRRLLLCAAGCLLLALLGSGCARDVSGGISAAPYPNQVNIMFQTREVFAQNIWYYMVFNFTQTSPTLDVSPFDQVSNENRGRNWQLYAAYTPAAGGAPARLVTLQRPALPTIVPTATGPSDATVADFGGDSQPDIIVACETAGVVQLIRAITTTVNLLDPVFYDTPVDIFTSPAPKFVFGRDFDADGLADVLLVDAGGAGAAASLRLLRRTGNSSFEAGAAVNISGRPVDALLADLNGDSQPDLVVATSGPAASEHRIEVFLNSGAGVFSAGTSVSVPAGVRGMGSGQLDDGTALDLAVGVATEGGAECVRVLLGDGSGGFTAGPVRSLPGTLQGLAVAEMNGTLDDIVATFTDPVNGGSIAAFLRNQASPDLATAPVVSRAGSGAGFVLGDELGNDQRRDAVFTDPAGNRINIMRGERDADTDSFLWNSEEILYPVGNQPARLRLAGLNADSIPDIVAINSGGAATDGNSIALYFGLGRYNYTNADIYWTDDPPHELQVQQWYLSHSIGPNSFTLSLDPALFYDLARQETPQFYDLARKEPGQFYVQFFTATTGIDLVSNPDQLGEVRDYLREPVRVPMEVGYTDDEQQTLLAGSNSPPVGAEDIVNWAVEVL